MSFKMMILRRYPSVSPDCPRGPWPRKLVNPFLVIERMKHESSWLSDDSDLKTVAEPRNLKSEHKSLHATGLSKKKPLGNHVEQGSPKCPKGYTCGSWTWLPMALSPRGRKQFPFQFFYSLSDSVQSQVSANLSRTPFSYLQTCCIMMQEWTCSWEPCDIALFSLFFPSTSGKGDKSSFMLRS